MNKNQLELIIKTKGLKITPPRIALLSLFSPKCHPISIDQILKKLKNKGINMVTIYRMISVFEKNSIINRVNTGKDKVLYEFAEYLLDKNRQHNVNHHHHHIICTFCGAIEPFKWCEIDKVEDKVLKQSKFKTINSHSIEFFGICKRCAA